jgi:hypothetical protein
MYGSSGATQGAATSVRRKHQGEKGGANAEQQHQRAAASSLRLFAGFRAAH